MFSLTGIFSIIVLVIFFITGLISVYLYVNREKDTNTKPDWCLTTSFYLQIFLIILFFTSSLGSLPEAIN